MNTRWRPAGVRHAAFVVVVGFAVVMSFFGGGSILSDAVVVFVGGATALTLSRPHLVGLEHRSPSARKAVGRRGLIAIGSGLVIVAGLLLAGAEPTSPLLGIAVVTSLIYAMRRLF